MKPLRQSAIAMACGVALATTLAQGVAQPTSASNKISITFKQMGVPVEAAFTKFSSSIQYDPAQPTAAKAQFTIDINSFDLGSAEYNKEVLKPQWFDAARYPTATFTTSAMKVLSASQLEATGTLTIKGKAQQIKVPVQVKTQGTVHTFEGLFKIQRTAFAIGTGEWEDTSLVADEVSIRVLTTAQAPK